jgi:hypothetical protein
MPIKGNTVESFKWFYRPESNPTLSPIVVVTSDALHEVSQAEIPGVLREIDDRHWSVIRQLLIEAKIQSEMQLRADQILSNPALVAHYQGWANCSDFILGSLEALRNGQSRQE